MLVLHLFSSLSLISAYVLASSINSAKFTSLNKRHAWPEVPRGWELAGVPDSNAVLDLRIGVKQHRFEELIDSLYEVSQPGQHR